MAVRCKVACGLKDEKTSTVYLHAVYSGSEENKQFFASTPGASFILYTVNPEVLAQFENGKEYYIDFTPA